MSQSKKHPKNQYMLEHPRLKKNGYDWWWHSFTGHHRETGEERAFFIEYFVMNPALGKAGPIFGKKPSYLMLKAGSWGEDKRQIHNFYGIDKLKVGEKAEGIEILFGEHILTDQYMKGEVDLSKKEAENHPEYMSDHGKMSWELKMNKQYRFDVGFGASALFRKLNAFKMYWHAEGMKTCYQGTVIYQGEVYDVDYDTSYGYQDKNWGTDYTSPWIWLNCNNFKYKGSEQTLKKTSLDIGGGRPVVFGIPLSGKILTCLYHEGKRYEFNFTKPWMGVKQFFKVMDEGEHLRWLVTSKSKDAMLEVDFICSKNDMIFANYENPRGVKEHNRLYNGGTAFGVMRLYEKNKTGFHLIAEFEGRNGGCEYGEF